MQKTISILLASLLLLSSSGLAYGQHFCGGRVMAEALVLGQKELSCSAGEERMQYEKKQKPDCCVDVYHQVETDSEYSGSSFDISFDKNFVAAFVSVFILLTNETYLTEKDGFPEYFPPPLEKDIPVLYQTFLI